jgi:peptide-methionine (R)-S-oxide reductase
MKYLCIVLALAACSEPDQTQATSTAVVAETTADSIVPAQYANGKLVRINKSDAEWKRSLSELSYYVMRQEGTERAFTGKLWSNKAKGTYVCNACGLPLFASATKFDSGTGWPSYYQPVAADYVRENKDNSLGMLRVEVECARCGGHLGHVFDDGPAPTGLRYCINSASLRFVKD